MAVNAWLNSTTTTSPLKWNHFCLFFPVFSLRKHQPLLQNVVIFFKSAFWQAFCFERYFACSPRIEDLDRSCGLFCCCCRFEQNKYFLSIKYFNCSTQSTIEWHCTLNVNLSIFAVWYFHALVFYIIFFSKLKATHRCSIKKFFS